MKQRTLASARRTVESFLRQQCAGTTLAVLSVNPEPDGFGGERLLVRCTYDDAKDPKGFPDSSGRERLEDCLRPELKHLGIKTFPVVTFIAESEVEQEPADERCDYIPVPPIGYDDEGYPVEDSAGQSQRYTRYRGDWLVALRDWCQRQGLGEVFSDLPLFYQRGQRNKMLSPDLMVALRAERLEERTSYKLWEQPTPEFALESLSNSTWRGDVGAKKRLYRGIGVHEYWLFDAAGKRIKERLRGYRLRQGAGSRGHGTYRLVPENGQGRRESEVLRLELCVLEGELRFYDPSSGEFLLTVCESQIAAREDRRCADEQEQRANAARQRADEQQQRANAERQRADEQQQRAAHERAARQAAESRIAALEAQLRALGQSD